MTDPDYSTWRTKPQAADAIGCSTKTIEQLAKDGKLQQTVWRPDHRGPARAVYHPDDVDRIARERRPGPLPAFVVPASAGASNGNGHGTLQPRASEPLAVPTGEDVIRLVFAAALRTLSSETSDTSENSENCPPTSFVTIREAAALTGLTQAYVRRAIAAQTLPAIRDRGWRIRRKDLEAL